MRPPFQHRFNGERMSQQRLCRLGAILGYPRPGELEMVSDMIFWLRSQGHTVTPVTEPAEAGEEPQKPATFLFGVRPD